MLTPLKLFAHENQKGGYNTWNPTILTNNSVTSYHNCVTVHNSTYYTGFKYRLLYFIAIYTYISMFVNKKQY